jgi:hypothetical protein
MYASAADCETLRQARHWHVLCVCLMFLSADFASRRRLPSRASPGTGCCFHLMQTSYDVLSPKPAHCAMASCNLQGRMAKSVHSPIARRKLNR